MLHPHHGSDENSGLRGPQPSAQVDGACLTMSRQKKAHRVLKLSPRCDTCNSCSRWCWPKQVTWSCLRSQDGEMQSCHVPAEKQRERERETNIVNTLMTFSALSWLGLLLVCAQVSRHMSVRERVPNKCPLCFTDFSLLPLWPIIFP